MLVCLRVVMFLTRMVTTPLLTKCHTSTLGTDAIFRRNPCGRATRGVQSE